MKRKLWTKEDIEYLEKNYSTVENDKICKILNISAKSLENKSYKLNLKKSSPKRKTWTKEEIEYLEKNYSNLRNDEICKILNISDDSLENKAHRLNLKKSTSHKSKMIAKRNKMMAKFFSYDMLKDIAKKYKSKGEFQKYDCVAHSCAKRMGYLDDICNHMIKQSFSIPQLILSEIIKIVITDEIIYDTRKIIKPYELDVFIPKYNLAFEYDGKGWHLNNKNDKIKDDLCVTKNIKLIRIVENNRDYINDIKTQLINKLDDINNYCKLNIQKNDIINIDDIILNNIVNNNVLNIDEIKKIISKYNNYHIFLKSEHKLHDKLKRMKMLHLTNDLKRDRETWTDDKIKNETSKYEYLLDFIQNSNGCYSHIKRNGLEYNLNHLKRKNRYKTI